MAVTALVTPANIVAGQEYQVSGTVTNKGNTNAFGSVVDILLSPFSDITKDGGTIGHGFTVGYIAPGQSLDFDLTITVPDNLPDGNYHLGAFAFYDEGNDSSYANNHRSYPVSLTGGVACELDASESDNSPGEASAIGMGQQLALNHCEGTSDWLSFSAVAGMDYGIALSGVEEWSDLQLYDSDGVTVLKNGQFNYAGVGDGDAEQIRWTAPSSDTYYIKLSPHWGVLSAGLGSGYLVSLGAQDADLAFEYFYAPSTAYSSASVGVSGTFINQGFADAVSSFDVGLYLSDDAEITSADLLLDSYTVNGLAVGDEDYGVDGLSGLMPETPGTYYIGIVVDFNHDLNESIIANNVVARPVIVSAPSNCTADSYEQDDSPASASLIVVEEVPQVHNHCEDLSDWVKFSANADESYRIKLTNGGSYSEASLEIYASDGVSLLADSDGKSVMDWTASVSGTYYVNIVSPNAGAGREYAVQLLSIRPDLTTSVYSGLHASSNPVPAGGVIEISEVVRNLGIADHGAFTTGVFLSTDASVTSDDLLVASFALDAGSISPGGSSGLVDTLITIPANTPPGDYFLALIADVGSVVTEIDETNNMSAVFPVQVEVPGCPIDAYEDDDVPADASIITLGEEQSKNYCDDRADWVSFTPDTSGAYTVTGDFTDIYLADGETLAETQWNSTNASTWLATAGTTYLIATSYNDPSWASALEYTLVVEACPADAYEEDDSYDTAGSISPGETQTRNLCDDLEDWVSFSAVSGQTYDFSTDTVSVDMELYDTDGQTYLTQSGTQGTKSVLSWTAPASGTYFLKAEISAFSVGIGSDYILKFN